MPNPDYYNIQDYTEAVLVEFNPSIISYSEVLKKWKTMSAPYPTKRQYRHAILCTSDEQLRLAQEFCLNMEHVDVEPVTKFYRAEEWHQHFLTKQRF